VTQSADTAVLLVNLGTPDSCSKSDIRKFLREFLSDPHVVDLPRALWLPLLWAFILPFRPAKLAHKYAAIWGDDDAPIRAITAEQCQALKSQLALAKIGQTPLVSYAMTYGNPSIDAVIQQLAAANVKRTIVIPLFPQYAAATYAPVFDRVALALKKQANLPELRWVEQYHEHPDYISALCESLAGYKEEADKRSLLVFSFHGIPMSQVNKGDPYPEQCRRTAELVASQLSLDDRQWRVTFQSRVGRAEWLQPYTDQTLMELPEEGKRSVTVICPGFAADCLETLEEINIENRQLFLNSGGEEFHYVPALNSGTGQIKLLTSLVESQLQDWGE
tara:strand:- start:796 stop:1794 length:999 start_codon:yes stop_codon:yes gene_type:complete